MGQEWLAFEPVKQARARRSTSVDNCTASPSKGELDFLVPTSRAAQDLNHAFFNIARGNPCSNGQNFLIDILDPLLAFVVPEEP